MQQLILPMAVKLALQSVGNPGQQGGGHILLLGFRNLDPVFLRQPRQRIIVCKRIQDIPRQHGVKHYTLRRAPLGQQGGAEGF